LFSLLKGKGKTTTPTLKPINANLSKKLRKPIKNKSNNIEQTQNQNLKNPKPNNGSTN
jgi:hypothetical protein